MEIKHQIKIIVLLKFCKIHLKKLKLMEKLIIKLNRGKYITLIDQFLVLSKQLCQNRAKSLKSTVLLIGLMLKTKSNVLVLQENTQYKFVCGLNQLEIKKQFQKNFCQLFRINLNSQLNSLTYVKTTISRH